MNHDFRYSWIKYTVFPKNQGCGGLDEAYLTDGSAILFGDVSQIGYLCKHFHREVI